MTDTVVTASGRFSLAQMLNAGLSGKSLVEAAEEAVRLASKRGAALLAVDPVGERIIGTASALRPHGCRLADRNTRLDGGSVLLVSGAAAGPVGLLDAAMMARSLGAAHVQAAVLGGWPYDVQGCESVECIGRRLGTLEPPKPHAEAGLEHSPA